MRPEAQPAGRLMRQWQEWRPVDSIARWSYRTCHLDASAAADYVKTYQVGYYAALWSKVERPLLEKLFAEIGGPDRLCLDFACGTGRITVAAGPYFGAVTGVDISEPMLLHARCPENGRLLHKDIINEPLNTQYDVA